MGDGCIVFKDVPDGTVLINRQDLVESSKLSN